MPMPEIPEPVRNDLEASIAEFQAAVIDAPIEDVGHDPDYRPDSPRLREQMAGDGDVHE